MPSQYIQLGEAEQYGLKAADTNRIVQASALIDAYLKRPEGLVWAPDSTGLPCYMAALAPRMSFTLRSAIAPGTNVPVSLNGPVQQLIPGDVLILDRVMPSVGTSVTEACIIATTTGPTGGIAITLQTVINAHAQGATADWGLVIEEQRYMPDNRPITRSSRTPLVRLISGIGRYGYGRRGAGANYNMEQFNLLAALSKFGGPPVWELWQPALNYSWDQETGQIWAPAGIMLAYYSEVKVHYVAGFQQSAIPSIVKLACAQLIEAIKSMPGMGNIKSVKAGDTSIAMATASRLDADTKNQLRPYMARSFA
jgi:hypothetical protein